jgi:pyruvate dehydrogenase E2 component (dihydrolipoamide acetyltransferase)
MAMGDETLKIVAWLKQPGEAFAIGDPILEVESSKATMEVEAPFEGVITTHLRSEGEEVDPGEDIAWCAAVGEKVDDEVIGATKPSGKSAEVATHAGAGDTAPWVPEPQSEQPPTGGRSADTLASAQHPRMPLPQGGDLGGVTSSGRQPARLATNRALPAGARVIPIRGRRAVIARQTELALAVPTFVVSRELEIPDGVRRLSDVLVLAAARAAARHPQLNAWVLADQIVVLPAVDVAFAVDTPDGVVAPVVRGAQALGLDELARRRRELVQRAQERTLMQSDLTNASITISNIGAVGGDSVIPVLTVPQVAALGVGRRRPGLSGPTLTATLVADHRAVDGADVARFLVTLVDELAVVLGSEAIA